MLLSTGVVAALIFSLPAGIGAEKKTGCLQEQANKCLYWQSRVDPSVKRPRGLKPPDTESDQAVVEGMECLLKLQGNKNESTIEGATSTYASQTFGTATVEVAALYYISYLYYKKWDHALAASLMSDGTVGNQADIVSRAYDAYRAWLGEVKKIGLAKAKERNMDPLRGTGIRWY